MLVRPLAGTLFDRSQLPLLVWFRCILYFTNASAGISTSFMQWQFGISQKAAFLMGSKIRAHLAKLDRKIVLGGSGSTVFCDEIALKHVAVRGSANKTAYRLLLLSDGTDFRVFEVPRGRFAKLRSELSNSVASGSRIEVRSAQTCRKILNHKPLEQLFGNAIFVTDDPHKSEYRDLVSLGVKLKQFILRAHLWISAKMLEGYIGHFSYLYRRRCRGDEAFWEAVSRFE